MRLRWVPFALVAAAAGFPAAAQQAPRIEWGGRADVHAPLRFGKGGAPESAVTLRRLRLEATVEVAPGLSVVVEPDFGEGEVELADGYVEAGLGRGWSVRAGRFKTPGVRESVASSSARWFAERAFPTALAPRRDLGVAAVWARGHAEVTAGVFNGVRDGASDGREHDRFKDAAARITLGLPEGFSVGLAGSAGAARGTDAMPGLAGYETPDGQTLLSYADGVRADGPRLRLAPDVAWEGGSLALRAEAALSRHGVRGPGGVARHTHRAWQAAAAYAFGGRPRVEAPLEVDRPVTAGGPGAVVVAARLHGLHLDAGAPALADADAATTRAVGAALSAAWSPRTGTRVGATAEHVVADGLAAPTTLTLQLEVSF